MKERTSMKRFNHYITFRCGYCDMYYIMHGVEPAYYNCGVYGWNCDIYTVGNIAITTGYRNMRGERVPDGLITEYTNRAKKILENQFRRPYTEICAELENNRAEFIAALMATYNG